MICTVIRNKELQEIEDILQELEMAEIRLDSCPMTEDEIWDCFEADIPLVATCRISEIMAANPGITEIKASQIAEKKLCKAIEAGASFVDVEIEAPKSMSKRVRSCAHDNGALFIRSYHNFEGTDSPEALAAVEEKCRYHGADIVKIVTSAKTEEDCRAVMSLYDKAEPGKLIAFAMGEDGTDTRMECLRKGAPFTYAAFAEDDEPAAPGQMTDEEMYEQLYGDRQFIDGQIDIPSSKSFAQRAVIAAALAEGTSHLDGYTSCGDTDAAIEAARALGAEVTVGEGVLTIRGIGATPDSLSIEELHAGESGLLARLMIPLLPQIAKGPVRITGEKTLLERPMKGAEEMMSQFGVTLRKDSGDCRIPLTVTGPMVSGRAEISGQYGSQLISGLLMSLPLGERNSSVIVRTPKSIPYMFITLDVMRRFGIKVSNEMLGGRDFLESNGDWALCTEMVFKVKGGQRYKAADFSIEGDWSSAANFLVAGAVFGRVEIDGLDTGSLQADLSIMDILMDAGACLYQEDGDDGPITVQRSPLAAFEADASNCPDLFPIISVLAAFCQGTSRIAGVSRLAHKESDRGKAILEMLSKMGVSASIEGDELLICGKSLAERILTGTLLKGGSYSSSHDHRMAMALKVAELGADGPITIDDEECVAKSFPSFFELFSSL